MSKITLGLAGTALTTVILGVFIFGISSDYAVEDQVASVESIQDRPDIMGMYTITKHTNGVFVEQVIVKNIIVDQGFDTLADLAFPDINLNGNGTDGKFDWLAIGTDATGVTATDVDLLAYVPNCERKLDATITGNSDASGESSAFVIFAFDGGECAGTIVESAIFNSGNGSAALAGEMLSRATFGGIAIASGDTLTVNYTITMT